MLERLEDLHSRFWIHRDIKPSNFAIGLGDTAHRIYLMDFGLAMRYRDSSTQEHIKFSEEDEQELN